MVGALDADAFHYVGGLADAGSVDEAEGDANIDAPKLFISAKSRTGLEELETFLVNTAALPEVSQSDVIVTNLRHYEALVRALDSIHRVQDGLAMQLSGDFVSQDLRECIHHLSDIVGEVSTDSVLQNIFKHFCIGK